MDWKVESLARARRARLQANNLRHSIGDLVYSLRSLGGYAGKCTSLEGTAKTVEWIITDLFELEGRLSHIE